MSSSFERIVAPSLQPVTLDEVKAQARIETALDDALLNGYIAAAVAWVERYTGLALLPQTWRMWLDDAPQTDFVALPKAPVQSIAQILLYAADDTSMVWEDGTYQLDNAAQPARLLLRARQSWPVPGRTRRGIAITYVAGYTGAAAVPEDIKLAVKQLATYWYEQRGEGAAATQDMPFGVMALLAPYRTGAL